MGMTADEMLDELGYRLYFDVELQPHHYDGQGHLNNAATAQLFNDMRISYIRKVAGLWWSEYLRSNEVVVAVRETHFSYESEGFPGEVFRGAMRYLRREGKGALFEQCMCEVATGRVVARAWGVQLVVQRGRVVDWPDEYFERIALAQGASIECRTKPDRDWGPGA